MEPTCLTAQAAKRPCQQGCRASEAQCAGSYSRGPSGPRISMAAHQAAAHLGLLVLHERLKRSLIDRALPCSPALHIVAVPVLHGAGGRAQPCGGAVQQQRMLLLVASRSALECDRHARIALTSEKWRRCSSADAKPGAPPTPMPQAMQVGPLGAGGAVGAASVPASAAPRSSCCRAAAVSSCSSAPPAAAPNWSSGSSNRVDSATGALILPAAGGGGGGERGAAGVGGRYLWDLRAQMGCCESAGDRRRRREAGASKAWVAQDAGALTPALPWVSATAGEASQEPQSGPALCIGRALAAPITGPS